MNKNAFCRFFKKETRKSLFTEIDEVHIGRTCQYLNERNMNILQICSIFGFKNIASINKALKNVRGLSITGYRKNVTVFQLLNKQNNWTQIRVKLGN